MSLTKNDLKGVESAVAQQVAPLAVELRGVRSEMRTLASEVHSVKLVQDAHSEQLNAVQATLSSHTLVLDALAKNSEDWRTERAFLSRRLDRDEGWIHRLAAHLGLKL